jgi:hypothetical protein
MIEPIKVLTIVGFASAAFVNVLIGQQLPLDGPRTFDPIAKLKEVRGRTFDENLAAITTEDSGLGNSLIMATMTNTLGLSDYFRPVFGDPRMRRMHEQLAAMGNAERQAALTRVYDSFAPGFDLMKVDDFSAGDFRLTHGLRCLLFLLCEYDDVRFEEVVYEWLAVRAFIAEKYPRGSKVDELGNQVFNYVPSDSLDELYLYNVYFQKLVRIKGRQVAEEQVNHHIRMTDASEPVWFIKNLTWLDDSGNESRVFSTVLGSGGGGRQLSLHKPIGLELLRMLREDVAKLDSK